MRFQAVKSFRFHGFVRVLCIANSPFLHPTPRSMSPQAEQDLANPAANVTAAASFEELLAVLRQPKTVGRYTLQGLPLGPAGCSHHADQGTIPPWHVASARQDYHAIGGPLSLLRRYALL